MQASIQDNEFAGLGVVVAGGNLGVGPAVVRAFAAGGARVAVGVPPGSTPLGDLPAHVYQTACDPSAPEAFLDACEAHVGGVRVLVVVPPPVKTMNALEVAPAEVAAIVERELLGPMRLIQECARRMIERGIGGRIMSFVSMSGKTGVHPRVAPYAAAKGGLIAYSRSLAAELAQTGVTVNAIATALFDVQLAGKTDEERAKLESGIPVGRAGRSEEAAHAALFLASQRAGYVTGETLSLSGGRFMD